MGKLARSMAFIATLMRDKKIDFKVASMPTADQVMLHIHAVISEAERDFISKRGKAALAKAEACGVESYASKPEAETRHDALHALADQNASIISKFVINFRKEGKTYK